MEGGMRYLSQLRIVGAGFVMVSAAWLPSAPALAQARTPLFTADQEACFGRVYDRAHLASHPNQKVTSLHIFRSLDDRPEAESWQKDQREQAIKRFHETGETGVQAFVTFRDRQGYFHNWLQCAKEGKDGTHCYIECDGGSFDLKRESTRTALLTNQGFVLVGGCGEDVEASESMHFSPGKDDKVFRLETKPPAVCRAEEQKARPIRPGKPLRERLGENEVFCFGRDYDDAHLAKHPRQEVVVIRVGRLTPDQERLDKNLTQTWPDDVRLTVSLTLKASPAARQLGYVCYPREASWECSAQSAAGAPSTCDGSIVQLTRTAGDDNLLVNRRSGLPVDAACRPRPDNEPGDNDGQHPTRSDDRIFKLGRMPIEACQ
jgi:hypothetical protein